MDRGGAGEGVQGHHSIPQYTGPEGLELGTEGYKFSLQRAQGKKDWMSAQEWCRKKPSKSPGTCGVEVGEVAGTGSAGAI